MWWYFTSKAEKYTLCICVSLYHCGTPKSSNDRQHEWPIPSQSTCAFPCFPRVDDYNDDVSHFLSVVDAAGKPKPGILKGQRTLVGDYDECTQISQTITADHVIEGLFCRLDVNFTSLAKAVVTVPHTVFSLSGFCLLHSLLDSMLFE